MVGPAAAEALLAPREPGAAPSAEDAPAAAAAAADDAAAAASLLLELHSNALARVGIPFLSIILNPVMDGIMSPVLKLAINMLGAFL